MYRVLKQGFVLSEEEKKHIQKNLLDDIMNALDGFEPGMTTYSTRWKSWITILDLKTCLMCRKLHGKIFGTDDFVSYEPPLHDHCRCRIEQMVAVFPGYATRDGLKGADYWLSFFHKLPDYYLTKGEAKAAGWRPINGNLREIVPDKMIGGDIYQNRNGHLPQAEGRIWYEADINYTGGYRSRHRILYSNDGLIFVTYNHYETFVEIV